MLILTSRVCISVCPVVVMRSSGGMATDYKEVPLLALVPIHAVVPETNVRATALSVNQADHELT